MAIVPTLIEVAFLDAAERIAKVTYRLPDADSIDDAALATSIVTAQGAADAIVGHLKTLSWSEVLYYNLIVAFPVTDSSANVGANNQVRAFTRTRTTSGAKSSFEVPAWDDFTYDQNSQNLLSAAYDTVAGLLAPMLADLETGEDMDSVDYSQSRTRKSRNIIHD